MFRVTTSVVRFLALCLMLSGSIDVLAAAETISTQPAAGKSRPSQRDLTKWIMNMWEGRWVPAERNLDKPYV